MHEATRSRPIETTRLPNLAVPEAHRIGSHFVASTAKESAISSLSHLRLPLTATAATAFGAIAGWGFAEVFDTGRPTVAAVHATFAVILLTAYERGHVFPSLKNWVRRRSAPAFHITSIATSTAILAISNVIATFVLLFFGVPRLPHSANPFLVQKVSYAVAMAIIVVATIRICKLVGAGTLIFLILGRYRRPRQEERVFLFLDLVGSTSFAHQHGDFRAHEFIGRAFTILSEPVRVCGGTISDYVGDMAIVTWSLRHGTKQAAAIQCVFAFLDELDRYKADWLRDFGQVPRFRAAIHCGPVVTAEIGLDRQKITYFGDVVNTTSRLEGLARTLNEEILVTEDVLRKSSSIPDDIISTRLGSHTLRGRQHPIQIFSLRRRPKRHPLTDAKFFRFSKEL